MKNKYGKYWNLSITAGLGSMLGSGIIVGLASTITVWQAGLNLTNGQVGIVSGALTFAIAFGSIFGSRIADKVGIIRIFNWINFLYAIGSLVVVFSTGFYSLLIGVIIAGIASGTDLPVSLAVISRDAPSKKMSSEMVASTQIFWQAGQFVSTGAAFVVSTMSVTGGRIVFAFFAAVSLLIWAWRTFSTGIKKLHIEGSERISVQGPIIKKSKRSVMDVLFHDKNSKMYLNVFVVIMIYYIFWNFVANTFGQFTTFMFVKAGASQTLSTGIGLGLHIAALFILGVYVTIAGSAKRNTWFTIGVIFAVIAMAGLAIFGATSVALIVGFMLIWGVGSMLSGEAIYKVWTQETFPSDVRASIQGFINGTSRFLCGLLAMVTPLLVLPTTIKTTMWGFVIIVLIFGLSGFRMIHLEKKYNLLDEEESEDSTSDVKVTTN
ncbi:MFS transporter [Secundilactobacillus kimchicus]|uniref:MFS transporter n=2 Tax=Secundilactobacillus kimchicus TaxID=528209 RepID=UPI001C01ED2D|nr:MFS transporter [Secundilactobacillus kimchicus]MBT9671094.1 MFS transporter [Secundilactobacillus kimchicus]